MFYCKFYRQSYKKEDSICNFLCFIFQMVSHCKSRFNIHSIKLLEHNMKQIET